jgi:inosine-uridine nucleoside N-ribohydrolase
MPRAVAGLVRRVPRLVYAGARLAAVAAVAPAVLIAQGSAAPAGSPAGASASAARQPAPRPPAQRVILDTDMGNDVDDALALAVLHALESRGESRLLAVTVTKDEPYAAPYVDLVNTFYGRPDIPIGVARSGITPGADFQTAVAQLRGPDGAPLYPHDLRDGRRAPEATAVLRRVLAAQPDSSVVLVQVGFSTNLARLLDTPGDAHSPLAGRELVARKVRVLQVMAGYFGPPERAPSPDFVEFNVERDIPSARALFARWPTPIEVSGWEVGDAVVYPAESIERDFGYVAHHPVRDGYVRYRGARYPYDRPTWDVTSALHAVRPDRNYFGRSEPGRVTVDARGRVHFRPEPGGPHRYLTVSPAQVGRAREAMVLLASEPPSRAAAVWRGAP